MAEIYRKDSGLMLDATCKHDTLYIGVFMYIIIYLQFDNKTFNVTGSLALGRKV